jgi:Domain of unknown function (DUF4386)
MDAAWERGARAAGAVFVVLAVVGFVAGGEAPKTSDAAADIAQYFDSNRGQVIAGSVLFAFGLVFLMWFAAAVANHLRESGEGRAAATVLVAGAVFVAVQLVLSTLYATLAFSIAGSAQETTKLLFEFDLALDVVGGLPAGLFILASSVGLKRVGSIPAWLAWAGVAVAAIELLRVTVWARGGFWSPSGGYMILAIVCGLLWILVTSIVLARREPADAPLPQATAG